MQPSMSKKKLGPSRRQPTDFSSTSVRLRLAMLVAALGLVILAMGEAAKPETWQRLGLAGNPNQAADQQNISVVSETNESAATTEATIVDDKLDLKRSNFDVWRSFFLDLDVNQLNRLNSAIDSLEAKQSLDNNDSTTLISIIKQLRRTRESESQAFPTKSDDPVDIALQSLYRFANLGEAQLDNGAAELLKHLIYRAALSYVEDQAPLNRSIERLAWNLTWERLNIETDEPQSVSFLQLSGQPTAYRGRAVKLEAEIRGLDKIKLPDNHPLGFAAYYVYWLKPKDRGTTPYCLYSSHLVNGLDDPGKQFVKLKQPITAVGRFFKLRTYEATNLSIEICPLIIANDISLKVAASPPITERWQPPIWLLIVFFTTMPLVAISLAVIAYRSTASNLRKDRLSKTEKQTLSDLAEDQDIKSSAEHLRALSDSEE